MRLWFFEGWPTSSTILGGNRRNAADSAAGRGGTGAIRAVLIFCDQPWFYNLTLPKQHGAEITFARLVSLPRLRPSFSESSSSSSIHLLRIPATWEFVGRRVNFSYFILVLIDIYIFEYFIETRFNLELDRKIQSFASKRLRSNRGKFYESMKNVEKRGGRRISLTSCHG